MWCTTTDNLDLNKWQARGGQNDAIPPHDGEAWDHLHDEMKTKQKLKEAQKVAMASVGKQCQIEPKTSPKVKRSEG